MTKLYSLSAAGKKAAFKEGSHAGAALKALEALGGQASSRQIADHVTEKKLLKTEMEVDTAIQWICGYLLRAGVLKAKDSK